MKLSQLATLIKLAKELGITIATIGELGKMQTALQSLKGEYL